MTETLEEVWARGGVAFGAWVTAISDTTVEILARAGYDYVGIDCQQRPGSRAWYGCRATSRLRSGGCSTPGPTA